MPRATMKHSNTPVPASELVALEQALDQAERLLIFTRRGQLGASELLDGLRHVSEVLLDVRARTLSASQGAAEHVA